VIPPPVSIKWWGWAARRNSADRIGVAIPARGSWVASKHTLCSVRIDDLGLDEEKHNSHSVDTHRISTA
jgi:hypothetical protein